MAFGKVFYGFSSCCFVVLSKSRRVAESKLRVLGVHITWRSIIVYRHEMLSLLKKTHSRLIAYVWGDDVCII